MKLGRFAGLIALSCILSGAGYWHLELTDSRPGQDAVITEPPTEIWLQFDKAPDLEQSGIALLGTSGMVRLEEVTLADSMSISAKVIGALEPGDYIASWRAAPIGDHGIRGRYEFTFEGSHDRH